MACDKTHYKSLIQQFDWVVLDLAIIDPSAREWEFCWQKVFSLLSFIFLGWDASFSASCFSLLLNYTWLLSLYSLNEISVIYVWPAWLVMPDWHWPWGHSVFAPQTRLSSSLLTSRKCETRLARHYGLSAVTCCGALRLDDVIAVTNTVCFPSWSFKPGYEVVSTADGVIVPGLGCYGVWCAAFHPS